MWYFYFLWRDSNFNCAANAPFVPLRFQQFIVRGTSGVQVYGTRHKALVCLAILLFLVRSCEATVIGYINWAGGTSGSVPTATVLSNCVVGTAGDWSISANITFTNFAQKG